MKTYNYRSRAVLSLIVTCLFASAFAASQAMAYDPQSHRGDAAGSACIIIKRIPNLGNNVIVNVYVDGAPFAVVGYGHSYEGFIAAGRHVVSVLPTPGPKWISPWQMTLDVRSGRTYSFTAIGDSGSLMLKGG